MSALRQETDLACMFENTPTFHTTRNAHALAVFCHCAAGDINTLRAQKFDDLIIRFNRLCCFFIYQDFDFISHRLSRMAFASIEAWYRSTKSISVQISREMYAEIY